MNEVMCVKPKGKHFSSPFARSRVPLNMHFPRMLPDLITEGVLSHVGRYNSQRVERLSGQLKT